MTTPTVDTRSGLVRWLQSAHSLRLGWALWAAYAIGVIIAWCVQTFVTMKPRTVTDVYFTAARNLLRGEPLYVRDWLHGFLYPPHSAAAFTPMLLPPEAVAEAAWRLIGMALLVWATWSLWRRVVSAAGRGAPISAQGMVTAPLFPLMSVVVAMVAAGSSVTGQANSLVGAGMVLAALSLADRRWWAAAGWVTLALAYKPHALPMVLVASVLWPAFAWRAALGALALLALPWVFADPSYIWTQHVLWADKMRHDAAPEPGTWSDLAGAAVPLLRALGFETVQSQWTYVRVALAPVTLASAWALRRGLEGLPIIPRRGEESATPGSVCAVAAASMVYLVCVTYVMLCNARTEGNTYAVFAPASAVFLALAMRDRRWAIAGGLGVCAVGMMFSRTLTGGETNFWVRPLAAAITVVLGVCWASGWGRDYARAATAA